MPRERKVLSGAGKAICALVMIVATLADFLIQIMFFAKGKAGWGITYLVFGWTITLTVAHWIGMLLAAPFLMAGGTLDRD
jgi:hypothetical protein